MYVIALIFIFLAFLQGGINLSLVKNGKHRAGIVLIGATCGMAMSFCAVDFTFNDIVRVFDTLATMQTISSLLVIESLGGIFFTIRFSDSLLNKSTGWRFFIGHLSLVPPIMLFAGLFFIQVGAVSIINGHSYTVILFSVTFLLTFVFYFFVCFIILIFRSTELLLELKLIVYLFQFIVAVFVPLVVVSKTLPVETAFTIDVKSSIVLAVLIVIVTFTGFVLSRIKKGVVK